MESEIDPLLIDGDVDEAFARPARKSVASGDGVVSVVDEFRCIGRFFEHELAGCERELCDS
jgi:hypothetical protein